jgi:hypothetical protein
VLLPPLPAGDLRDLAHDPHRSVEPVGELFEVVNDGAAPVEVVARKLKAGTAGVERRANPLRDVQAPISTP